LVCSLLLHFCLLVSIPHIFLKNFQFLRNVYEALRFQISLFLVFFHNQLIVLLFILIVLIIIISFYSKFKVLLFSFEPNFLYFTILFLRFLFFLYFPRSSAHLLSIFPLFCLFLFLSFLVVKNEIIIFVRTYVLLV
jgi:hypothetical protein